MESFQRAYAVDEQVSGKLENADTTTLSEQEQENTQEAEQVKPPAVEAQTAELVSAEEKMIAEPFAKQAELEAKTARYNEVMAILNPKEEQVIGEDDGETQYQAREYLEESKKPRYNKKTKYSETETLFLQWENGSSPVGEVKQFTRFKEHHFYEKTADGCVEITAEEFAVKGGRNLYEDFRQANREVDEAAYDDESQEPVEDMESAVMTEDDLPF